MNRALLAASLTAALGLAALGFLPQTFADTAALSAAEDAYFAAHGTYFQVLKQDRVPPRENGTTVSNLGKHLPSGMSVDTYQQADGQQGYVINYEAAGNRYAIGFGPQAAERTSVATSSLIATTTP